jgi:ribosome biogenesis GTPase
VSRFLVSIEASGLPLTLALNKADLVPEEEVEARVAQCAAWGYRAVPVSCASGRGLDALGAVLAGKMSVVAGPSGAGKSSLINALRLGRHRVDDFGAEEGFGGGGSWADGGAAEEEAEQDGCSGSRDEEHDRGSEQEEEEGEQRWHSERAASGAAAGSSGGGAGSSDFLVVGDMSRFGRGKHTTRVVRLIPLPGGGLMADTPGFGLPTLDRVPSAGLAQLFPEFRAARAAAPGGGCRFVDCMHVMEPGCAVNEAGLERYPHYLKFLAEVKVGRLAP